MPARRSPRSLRARLVAVLLVLTGLTAGPALATEAREAAAPPGPDMPVVLTGAQLPGWSGPPAAGVAAPWPDGALSGERTAHGEEAMIAADTPGAARPEEIAAFRWEDGRWREVPVQVDERFPYFLANPDSDFGIYSGTDQELTYEWDAERWKMEERPDDPCRVRPLDQATEDPVTTLDDDDEIVFMASDAGAEPVAPAVAGPPGTRGTRQQVVLTDPNRPDWRGYVYLFQRAGGSSFTGPHYVRYQRDAGADDFIDADTFRRYENGSFVSYGDPEQLGSSNRGYGPNVGGTVCDPRVPGGVRLSTDRFPRDGVTVTTDRYRWYASGRWMVRSMQVAAPDRPGQYGPDLVDRWKGRAFQQSPDSAISLVGFEDEQVNWEANSALLGELAGPVRAIREVWGADSGTNVTKTETFYRSAVTYRYRIRVHPIPPDGLYTSWDYNAGVATRYFSSVRRGETESVNAVAIDGRNDDAGNVDGFGSFPAYFDAPDPTLNVPVTLLNWEQVSGAGGSGSLVYVLENKGPTSVASPAVVPYYRDDKCLDDGTGDDPVPRPWPGEASTDQRVRDGYAARAGVPYEQLTCDQKQGAWGSHGLHFFALGDTDNAFTAQTVNEVDAQQWQFAVPTAAPEAVGEPYHLAVRNPVAAAVTALPNTAGERARTTLALDGPGRVQVTDGFTASAALTDDRGDPVAGARVTATFRSQTREAVTDGSGTATFSFGPVAAPAETARVTATYAGDRDRAPSNASATVEVVRETSAATLALSGDRPFTVADVTLAEPDGPIAGRPVRLVVNGALRTTVTTDGDGRARAVLQLKKGDVVRAVFAGDESYEPASAQATRR